MVDLTRFIEWAFAKNNAEAIRGGLAVVAQWRGEVADTSFLVKSNIAWTLLVSDPFSGSRHAFTDLRLKYPEFK